MSPKAITQETHPTRPAGVATMSQRTLLLIALVILVAGSFAISAPEPTPSKDPPAEARIKLARKLFEETLEKSALFLIEPPTEAGVNFFDRLFDAARAE